LGAQVGIKHPEVIIKLSKTKLEMFQVFARSRNASSLKWLRDTQHNDSQNNDTQDADILQKGTAH
jgi:hypothetical protein